MMSSAGHIFDMITRNKNNEALKGISRNRHKKVRESYLKHAYQHFKYIDRSKLSSSELKELKSEIRNRIIKGRRKQFMKSIIATVFVIIIVSFLIYKY